MQRTTEEIEYMKKACELTCERMKECLERFSTFKTEKEVKDFLEKGHDIASVIDDSEITMPICPVIGDIKFGSIYKTIMDVKNKTLYYKEPSLEDYVEVKL